MQILKANTAVDVLIGPFVDDSDGKTAETGLTLSQADIKLSKNGQALTQKNDDTAASHDSDGYYNCELDATDTNTEGTLVLIVNKSGALPVRHDYMVMAEAAYDSLFAAKDSGYMDVNVKAVSEDTAAADNLESACDNYSATRGLAGTALPDAVADAAGGLPISDAGGLDLDTILGRITANVATEAKQDTIDTVVDAIKAVTDNLPDSGALSDLASILTDTNELQTDLTDGGRLDLLIDAIKAVTDNLPDSGALTSLATAAALTTVDTVVDAIKAVTDNLPNSGALSDLATILTDTNEIQGDLTDGGRLDLLVDAIKAKTDNLPADPASETNVNANETKLDTIAGYLDTEIAAILEDTGTTLPGLLTTIDSIVDAIKAVTDNLPNGGALTDLATAAALTTVDTVVDAIKVVTDNLPDSGALNDLAAILTDTNELQTDLTDGGRLDLLVDAIKAKTDNLKDAWNDLSAAQVNAECDTAISDAALATAAALATVDTVVDAIKAKTDNLKDAWNDLSAAEVNAEVDTALADYDPPTKAELDSGLAGLNDIAVSDITGAEVDNDGSAISLAGALKLLLAVLTGKSSGGGTSTIVFRDIADAKNRISATVDANGNRTAVGTRDAS